MPAIIELRLTDAEFLVGPNLEQLQGFGDDKFTLAPATDVGSAMGGVNGDTMHVFRIQNLWVANITFMTAGTGITQLLTLHDLQTVFPVKITYGEFSLVGFGSMQSLGEMAVALGNTTRTMVMNISKVSGNTSVSPGRVVQIL